MKKFLSVLIAVLLLCSLCACDSSAKLEELCGVWAMKLYNDADTAENLLSNVDMYPEEIAVLDLESSYTVMIVEYTADKTYRYGFDVEATKEGIREYFAQTLDTLYEERNQLTDLYGMEVGTMSQKEFEQYYAELYSEADVDSLLDMFTENCMDYTVLSDDLETGTFRLKGSSILCTVSGTSTEEAVGYSINGKTLTLSYADGEEVYTKQ